MSALVLILFPFRTTIENVLHFCSSPTLTLLPLFIQLEGLLVRCPLLMKDLILALSRSYLFSKESLLVVAGNCFLLLSIQVALSPQILLIFDLPSLLGHLDEPLLPESLLLLNHLGVGCPHLPLYHLGCSFSLRIEHHTAEGQFVVEPRGEKGTVVRLHSARCLRRFSMDGRNARLVQSGAAWRCLHGDSVLAF